MVLTQTTGLLNHLKPLLCYVKCLARVRWLRWMSTKAICMLLGEDSFLLQFTKYLVSSDVYINYS